MPGLAAFLMFLGSAAAGPALCVDGNDNCRGWAAQGECETNSGYMYHHCPASCGTCPPRPEEVFDDLDSDKDGKVTSAELSARIKRIHELDFKKQSESRPNDEEANKKKMEDPAEHFRRDFATHDADEDGSVSLAEMLAYMQKSFAEDFDEEPPDAREELKEEENRMRAYETARYAKSDLDGSGSLTLAEFVYGRVTHMHELDHIMQNPDGDAKRQIARLDTDADGERPPSARLPKPPPPPLPSRCVPVAPPSLGQLAPGPTAPRGVTGSLDRQELESGHHRLHLLTHPKHWCVPPGRDAPHGHHPVARARAHPRVSWPALLFRVSKEPLPLVRARRKELKGEL